MTRRDALDRVFAGIEAAASAGLSPVKVNCVVIVGTNDDEVVEFARWSRQTGHEVRFIEYMPLDADHQWERDKVAPAHTLFERINVEFPLEAVRHGPEPATSYRFADGSPGGVGFIASVTEPFCNTCNRLRLTSEGHLRTCLFALDETGLRDPLREGAAETELAATIRAAVTRKWSGHRINHSDFVRPDKSMSMIGG
jgi:cyclic pyranopterin phosphate synthase